MPLGLAIELEEVVCRLFHTVFFGEVAHSNCTDMPPTRKQIAKTLLI